ncbi:MAG: GNAT family N-acetyltransferase [Acidobacteriaceae bacterium]
MTLVRAATGRDARAISHVHVQSWRTTYAGIVPEAYLAGLNEEEREQLWREWLKLDIPVYVAELGGGVVGFVSGGPIREPLQEFDAELYAIYLLQQAQGRGIGTALLRQLAGSLRARGFKSMAVWVLESNSSSRFYMQSGAIPLLSKDIEIGGVMLPLLAYGWTDLQVIPSPV